MRRFRLFVLVTSTTLAIASIGWVWHRQCVRSDRDAALMEASDGHFTAAEPPLQKALRHDPSDVDVLSALAKGYLASDRRGEAADCLNRWLDLAPHNPEALQLRSTLYRNQGAFDRALADLDQLLVLQPDDRALLRRRAGLLFSAGRFAEADAACRECLVAQPEDHALRRLLAEAKRARGAPQQAGEILDRLLHDAPNDPATLMARALLHYEQDECDKAVPLLRKVLERDPNRQRTGRYHLSLALARVGQVAEAQRLMAEVRRMQDAEVLLQDSVGQPENLALRLRAARAQFENNDLARAHTIIADILSRAPAYAPAHALLAEVYDKEQHFELAAEQRRWAQSNP